MKPFILITGASRGIGKAIALYFAKKGENLVILSSKSPDKLSETANQVREYGVLCYESLTDVSDFSQLERLKNQLDRQQISIGAIINNAGISYFGLIQDMTCEEWNRVITTNLSSVFYTTKLFLDGMIRSGQGCIINISSVFGTAGASCEAAYSAAKGGMNAFTKALAKELAPSHIRVNAIACGAIDTSMNNRLLPEEKETLENEIPAGRMGTPEEVASLAYAVFCQGDYLTGQIITIDGGWF